MAPLQSLARRALAARLRGLLPAERLHPGGEHALALADALVPTLAAGDVAWAHAALAARAKGELRPAASGAVPAHAAWSSTALVCSAWAPWRAALPGLALEERLHVPHGGGTPNLDVALRGEDVLVGVESKLTEHLAPAPARPWKAAYRRPAMLAELAGGWADVLAALLEGAWVPRFAPAAQLVKHALSLRAVPERETHLAYLFWEPADGDELPEVREHRDEVAELLARVGDAPPRLHARSWPALWRDWATARPEHVAALRARYHVPVLEPAPAMREQVHGRAHHIRKTP